MATKAQKEEALKEKLAPKVEEVPKAQLSKFKVKDELFVKEKTFVKDGKEDTISADWLNLHIKEKMTFFKGKPLTKAQLANFDQDAKKYYLEEI